MARHCLECDRLECARTKPGTHHPRVERYLVHNRLWCTCTIACTHYVRSCSWDCRRAVRYLDKVRCVRQPRVRPHNDRRWTSMRLQQRLQLKPQVRHCG